MTNQHPITPPLELLEQLSTKYIETPMSFADLVNEAARWGAEQELEACCEWFANEGYGTAPDRIRNHRRPKPPSLKEQALTALSHLLSGSAQTLDTTEAEFYIRRALEALPND